MWTVGLTVEIKLSFRDGLVWTVGLTVEITLSFQTSQAWYGRCLTPRPLPGIQLVRSQRQKLTEPTYNKGEMLGVRNDLSPKGAFPWSDLDQDQ